MVARGARLFVWNNDISCNAKLALTFVQLEHNVGVLLIQVCSTYMSCCALYRMDACCRKCSFVVEWKTLQLHQRERTCSMMVFGG